MNQTFRLLLALTLIFLCNCQAFEFAQSGMVRLPAIPFNETSSYRNFTLVSATPSFLTNGSLIFSFVSFNYFYNQMLCYQNSRNSTRIIITCSPNIEKISYLLLERSPNIFLLYNEKFYYERDTSYSSFVNITEWKDQIKIPLKSLIKNQPIVVGNQRLQNQYKFQVTTFISGLQTFSFYNISSNSFNSVKNQIININLTPIYQNITLSQYSSANLCVPSKINITRSLNIKKLTFFTLIVIREMPSLNLQFEEIVYEKQNSGLSNMGGYIGLNSLQFIIDNNEEQINENIKFNIQYDVQPKYIGFASNYSGQQKIFSEKLYKINKTNNLKAGFNRLKNTYWLRCYGNKVIKYERWMMPKEGKVYRIVPYLNSRFSLTNIKYDNYIYSYANLQTQKFYFKYLGSNRYKIFSSVSNQPLRALSSSRFIKTSSIQNQKQDQWILQRFDYNNKIYYQFKSIYRTCFDVDNSEIVNGTFVIHYLCRDTQVANQLWSFVEVSSFLTVQTIGRTSNLSQSNICQTYSLSKLTPTIINYVYSSQLKTSTYQSTYGFFSLQNQICYSQSCVNQTNIYSTNQSLYKFDLIKNLSQISSFQAIISGSNLITGSFYSFCINNNTLQQFFVDMYNTYTKIKSQPESNVTSSVNNSMLNYEYFGCKQMKKMLPNQSQIECSQCSTGYSLYEAKEVKIPRKNQIINTKTISTSSKACYCDYGYFMDTVGTCHSCQNHPTKCQISLKLSGQTLSYQTNSTHDTLKLYVNIFIHNQINYFTDLSIISQNIIVYINDKKYYPKNFSFYQQADEKLVVQLLVEGIAKQSQYNIYAEVESKELIDSYVLVEEEFSIQEVESSDVVKASFGNEEVIRKVSAQTNLSSQQTYNRNYFTKLQLPPSQQLIIKKPFQVKQIATKTVQPIIKGLNSSSSVILLAAPFLIDKINLFSILQTNTLLYLISFLRFETDQKSNADNQIVKFANKMFIFKSQPYLNLFQLEKRNQNSDNKQSRYSIKLPYSYETNFTNNFLYSQNYYKTLNYPQNLYINALPSLNNQQGKQKSQNYLTLTLNSIINILIQVLVIQFFIKGMNLVFSTRKEKVNEDSGSQKQQKAYKIVYEIKRHLFVKRGDKKYIQWLPAPELNQKQKQQDSIKQQIKQTNQQQQQHQQQPSLTLRHHILLFVQTIKQKRLIFYTSFILIQLISQSYLMYFQLVKPFDVSSSSSQNSYIVYVDLIFGLLTPFFILVFPVFLINYQPLNLLKIVQIIYKHNNYTLKDGNNIKINDNNKNDQNSTKTKTANSYTYQQLFLNFCIIYYQNIFISYSIAIGPTVFYQSLPIAIYQVIKFIWMYKRLKIFDKIKIVLLAVIFGLASVWRVFGGNQMVQKQVLQNVIVWGIYLVLVIELVKIFKFFVVTGIKYLKTKIERQNQNQNSQKYNNQKQLNNKFNNNNQPKNHQQKNNFQIFQIEQQNTTQMIKQQATHSQSLQIGSQKLMLQKKKQKLQNIKQKSQMLKQLTEMRENLQNDLEDMKKRRRVKNGKKGWSGNQVGNDSMRIDVLGVVQVGKMKENNNINDQNNQNQINNQNKNKQQPDILQIINFNQGN